MSSCSKRWHVKPPAPPDHFARFSHLHPITAQVLYNRGIVDPEDAARFLSGEGGEANPFALEGMHEAVTRLRQALRADEAIAVYGDFDTDGVTATVLLVQTLRALGGQVKPYIPHRVDEGYGLHEDALTQLKEKDGVHVIVTVDCGIRSLDEIAHARRLGLDTIVTDHHSVGPQLPDALAVIDPKRTGSRHPFGDLAGVGVAYKLAQALLRSHRQTPVTRQAVQLEEADLLDLVALGTVADMVPLRGENRTLVHRGLESINRLERPGIKALCQHAGLQAGRIDATSIGYALGPRLNAAGRLAHAITAYELLDAAYPAEAERLAEQLDHLNQERRRLTKEMQERARQLALEAADTALLLFAADPSFQAGIVGLVASHLVEEFYRPAVVIELGEEISHGSARSIPEFHITEALDQCADLLIRHGGHAAAAGLTIRNENLAPLEKRLRELAGEKLAGAEPTPALEIDAEVKLPEMVTGVQHELAQIEPCGYENPQPLFLSRAVRVRDRRAVGSDGKHLKLTLADSGSTWDAIAFRLGEWAHKLPDAVDLVYHLELNEWNGQTRLQLNVQDLKPAGCEGAVDDLPQGQPVPGSAHP